ncbi:response regulator receiver protein [Natrialba hulunbeirensis JCM 10989]|uniref:Response regulator receiver protein n=1 Tax=Natrialba hulunbeirensis JCM 10989 TaxID=1227493 RepID=M0A3E8_9EURY|nr:response regulator [Natrialba hulunbeirensis]ELY93295.1 response regulator receiver protein [Natrialba hulunbeirensis JCM 10989]
MSTQPLSPSTNESVHILLVEDNPGDVRLAQEAFRTVDIETTFHTVRDGDEALSFLREQVSTGTESASGSRTDSDPDSDSDSPSNSTPDIDLVLLDLNLPRTSGFEVLEEVRDDPDLASLPVLVLTSSEATEDIARSYDLCANAYLTKPNGPSEFASLGEAVESFWMDEAVLPPTPS